MLASQQLTAFVATTDTGRARAFYGGTLGLTVTAVDDYACMVDANGTPLRVTKVETFAPHPFTVLGWAVADIEATVTDLAGQGVPCLQFGFAHMPQDEHGIWDAPGGDRVAWFHDPDGNMLSVTQHAPRLTPATR